MSKKSGNPYNFNQVHYNGPDRGVEGMAALTLNLDPSLLPYADIKIGGEYEVDFGPRGYVVRCYLFRSRPPPPPPSPKRNRKRR